MSAQKVTLEDLVFHPTQQQQRELKVRQRLGKCLVSLGECRIARQTAERLAERRAARIAELEARLLEKSTELGGLRMAIFEAAPHLLPELDARVAATAAEDRRFR